MGSKTIRNMEIGWDWLKTNYGFEFKLIIEVDQSMDL